MLSNTGVTIPSTNGTAAREPAGVGTCYCSPLPTAVLRRDAAGGARRCPRGGLGADGLDPRPGGHRRTLPTRLRG